MDGDLRQRNRVVLLYSFWLTQDLGKLWSSIEVYTPSPVLFSYGESRMQLT